MKSDKMQLLGGTEVFLSQPTPLLRVGVHRYRTLFACLRIPQILKDKLHLATDDAMGVCSRVKKVLWILAKYSIGF